MRLWLAENLSRPAAHLLTSDTCKHDQRSTLPKKTVSLIDPRDGIMLYTKLDDHCDKLAVDWRSSEILSSYKLTDDGPVYHALSAHLCRAMF